jgi:putative Holliday junction resolvase
VVYCTCLENRSAARYREFESHPLRMTKYLGIDYGSKQIGIATSDESGSLAFPLTTVSTGPNALGELIELINRHEVESIVIGESRDLNGQPNPIMKDIEKFKKDLSELSQLPVNYHSEMFTSAQAARQFAPESKSRKKKPNQDKLDAAAAALILQGYLDTLKQNGNYFSRANRRQ